MIINKNGHVILIDPEDWHILQQATFGIKVNGGHHYVYVNEPGKWQYLHRLIMRPTKGLVVDHINGNGLDNRRSNLRAVSHQTNLRNRRKKQKLTSTHRGVCWAQHANKWRAVCHMGGYKHLGYFETEAEALAAWASHVKEKNFLSD